MSAPSYAGPDVERQVPEADKPSSATRSPFERDRARVLHSAAFRRLAAKTQVVGVGVDDFPRTRLTHSLECAQIGRELAAALGADPDLVDAACLAHDLGHPPFGHNGEQALDDAAAAIGGFEGNAQSLRVLCRLEAKSLREDGRPAGLNLTRATLDATMKYPWPRRSGTAKFGVYTDDRADFDWVRDGAPGDEPSLEAQIMDWADDVAYSVHDLEDGIQAGQVDTGRLDDPEVRDQLADLAALHYSTAAPTDLRPVLDEMLSRPWWVRDYDGATSSLVRLKRTTSELIGRFCASALKVTRAVAGDGPLRRYSAALVVPDDVRAECALLKAVTHCFVMGRPGEADRQRGQRRLVAELLEALADGAPATLEPSLRAAYADADDDAGRLRTVVDQVASLTDTSAEAWHRRLVGSRRTAAEAANAVVV